MLAALSVQSGSSVQGSGAQSGAAGAASAFWPFKNEGRAPSDHLGTPSLEHTQPLPHVCRPSSPPHGGSRTGNSMLTQDGFISMLSPTSSVQSAIPKTKPLACFFWECSVRPSSCKPSLPLQKTLHGVLHLRLVPTAFLWCPQSPFPNQSLKLLPNLEASSPP